MYFKSTRFVDGRDMYEQYWGLKSTPFLENGRENDWVHTSPPHEEALARLYYLVEQGRRLGIVTGPQGSGKTILLNALVSEARRSQRDASVIELVGLSGHEMLWQLAASLKLDPRDSEQSWSLWRRLEDHLRAMRMAQSMTVIAFDHLDRAQSDCVAVLQRLVHLERSAPCCTTFVVSMHSGTSSSAVGSLAQLSDLRVELAPFTLPETGDYIRCRLEQVGCERAIFDSTAIEQIFERSQGIIRDINRQCELSLLAAMAEDRRSIDGPLVLTVAAELQRQAESASQSHPLHELIY